MNRPHLLHIEDDVSFAKLVDPILADAMEVSHATSIDDAKEVLEKYQLDLVLLDLQLRDGSGIDLIKQVKQHQPNAKIIIHSGFEITDVVPDVYKVLYKPHTKVRDLIAEIHEALGLDTDP